VLKAVGRWADDKPPPPPPKEPPKAFVPDVERTVRNFVDMWQERDERTNFAQRAEMELVRSKVRPLVFDEVRVAVDAEMRAILGNIKVCWAPLPSALLPLPLSLSPFLALSPPPSVSLNNACARARKNP
jgi:hypothetical protein